jgi:hypothetical protein
MTLACTGTEEDIASCPAEVGQSVQCAPSDSAVIKCSGEGDAMGSLPKGRAPVLASSMLEPQALWLLPRMLLQSRGRRSGTFL